MAASGDGVLAPDITTVAEAMTSPVTSEAAVVHPAASTSPMAGAPSSLPQMAAATASTCTDGNAVEEPEVIMGHPSHRASGTVSLSEAMGTVHFVLNQVHDVLYREREDINEERLRVSVWVSLLKQWTTYEKEKVEARQKRLDMMEILYNRRQVVADKLDAQTQKPQRRLVPMPPSSSKRTSTHKQWSWLNDSRHWQSRS
jgi:hypothetical protein